MEERWFFDALTESYIPLLLVFEGWRNDRIRAGCTLSLSPTLLTMLQDEYLIEKYRLHLNKQIALAEQEMERNRKRATVQKLAAFYRERFSRVRTYFEIECGCDLLSRFRLLADDGPLELITTAATHGFLPLLKDLPGAVESQLDTGLQTFECYMGMRPRGFWLPECAYYEQLDELLIARGIHYTFLDSHAFTRAEPVPEKGLLSPARTPAGLDVFARDPASSEQVWSSENGYPGDADYREYYRDIGFELELEELSHILPGGTIRLNTGMKYRRITGTDDVKAYYDPDRAAEKARQHAQHFVDEKVKQIRAKTGTPFFPVITAPFDAELFGHWWYEGPQWLDQVIRISNRNDALSVMTASTALQHADPKMIRPVASSWGYRGHHEYWLNSETDWIWPRLKAAAEACEHCRPSDAGGDDMYDRMAQHARRCLLLAESSDWPFILRSGTTVEYAEKRILHYLKTVHFLAQQLESGTALESGQMDALEYLTPIFPKVDRFRGEVKTDVSRPASPPVN